MKEHIAFDGQSLLDISIQYYGTAEGVFALCEANGIVPDDLPIPGQAYKIPVFAGAILENVSLIEKQGIVPASMSNEFDPDAGEEDNLEGINYWAIEEDFEVQPNPGDPEE